MSISDPFQQKHRADERAAEKQVQKDAVDQAKQATARRMLDKMKPVFNDIPPYKFKDVFKLGAG